MRLIQGNEAVALGALHAGCTFYAGYPITPSSEIMEWMARLLPARGGTFVQMEDEIGSLAAVIGASWAGAKAMTATSGPGFSLMQEHVGYAAMTETPCVIVNSMRGGPSTGLPSLPAQGDVMQARWGSHGDRAAIALTASSVRDAYVMTVEAFNLAERFRQPVVLLLDAVLSHMRESVELPHVAVAERARGVSSDAKPFGGPEFIPLGAGRRVVVTGLAHDDRGAPRASDGAATERQLRRTMRRLATACEEITHVQGHRLDDAEVIVLSYGITARTARAAVDALRADGLSVGALELQTLWPFCESLIARIAAGARAIVVPELNLQQMALVVRAAVAGAVPVLPVNKCDGTIFGVAELVNAVRAACEVHHV